MLEYPKIALFSFFLSLFLSFCFRFSGYFDDPQILSHGLLLPTMVAGKYGITRTDEGLLGMLLLRCPLDCFSIPSFIYCGNVLMNSRIGCGLYFSDSAATSLKYTAPCARNGMRYMLVSQVHITLHSLLPQILIAPPSYFLSSLLRLTQMQVVLGKVHTTTQKLSSGTTSAPDGCDSVHAVAKKSNSRSTFVDDEFCIYLSFWLRRCSWR